MKRFIYSIIAFSVLNTSLYMLIRYIVKPEITASNDYMAAMIDKHERINKIKSPKLIFGGGSNLAFGLNSEKVEKEFAVPVVNLSLHGGLGLNFMLNELRNTIKNGDIVFLSIEYFLRYDGNYKLKKNTSTNYKEAIEYYSFDLRAEILIDLEKTRENIKSYNNKVELNSKQDTPVYSREAFNKYGDVVGHFGKDSPEKLNDRKTFTYKYWDGIDELNEFYNYAKSKNVKVFFLYPNLPATDFNKNQKVIQKLSRDLSSNLQIEIINSPTDFVFPDSLFFDTVYHLNKEGREIRTKKLIELIKKNKTALQSIKKMQLIVNNSSLEK